MTNNVTGACQQSKLNFTEYFLGCTVFKNGCGVEYTVLSFVFFFVVFVL